MGGFSSRSRGMAAALIMFSVAGCTDQPPHGTHWRVVSSVDGGFIQFVQLDAVGQKDRAVYDEAVAQSCGGDACLQVGFFGPGDKVPADTTRQAFFADGGWSNYHSLATYAKGDQPGFTQWDCERAATDAPLDALCGPGVRDEYDAVGAIASRDGWVIGCGLPDFKGKAVVDAFVATFKDDGRRKQFLDEYDEIYNSAVKGPDDPQACNTLRSRIVGKANAAKALLIKATH